MVRLVAIDNFDSFTYNLVKYSSEQTVEGEPFSTEMHKNTVSLDEIRDLDPGTIVISPGPGHPKNDRDVSATNGILTELPTEIPTLGVCLGLEVTVYAYSGTIGRAPEPIHGKAFPIGHDGAGVFVGLENGFPAGRHRSLVATDAPDCFDVSAATDHNDETLAMGVRHRDYPIECVQLHPESVLTRLGYGVVKDFLTAVAGSDVA